ncbi:MAG TPA: hypothetical protein VND68_12250 [Chloroflexia bacterium]|nr:hypothetical protein [Chloroflexia bacterium]
MAEKDTIKQARQKSKFAAMEALRDNKGFPIPPRKAMSRAKKVSKKLAYPLPPYAGANLVQLYRWGQFEWRKLGRWQQVVLPVVVLNALLTWEREKELQDRYWDQVDRAQAKEAAAQAYGAYGPRPRKRKLFGIIPLPGGK